MNTVEDVLGAFGGATVVAQFLGVTDQAVSNMKARGTFPSAHWSKLVAEAEARNIHGITFEKLSAIQAAKKASAA